MSDATPYVQEFYQGLASGVRSSARVVVPLVVQLLQPKSVIDVGCGTGIWLSVFREQGVHDICGLDGGYVGRDMLEIPPENFIPFDLTRPIKMDREFDLVISLEVAEHLPEDYAEQFVDSLVGLGSVILFSAAIPFQGGLNHVNEQWQDYWVAMFQRREYIVVDCIREHVWKNDAVDPWYAQNMFLFVKRSRVSPSESFRKVLEHSGMSAFSVVHPQIYLQVATRLAQALSDANPNTMAFSKLLAALPVVFFRALTWRAQRVWMNIFPEWSK